MTDLSRKTYLFYDSSASYVHMAEAVVPDVARVLYFSPWETGFSNPLHTLPGEGLDGIERVADFWDVLSAADLVVFCDVGNGGLQTFLRSEGYAVFGSAAGGRLEQDRALLKSTCRKLGIDIADYTVIRGVDNLREFLMGTEDECYVKISYMRGLLETFHHLTPFASRAWLDDVSLRAGPYGSMAEFLIEKPIEGDPCVEVGYDTFSADGAYPDTIAWGYEVKDAAFGLTLAPLPARIRGVADKFGEALSGYGYRGPLSVEIRVTSKKDYLIDPTCRFPEPPSSLQRFMIANWAEIMWEAAHGRIVEPEYVARVGVQIVMKSQWGAEHPLAVRVGRPDRTTLHGHCNIEGQDYAVSPAELEEFGAATGMGNTLSEAMEDAVDAAEAIEGFQVSFDSGALEKLTECIQTGNELGLTWR